MPSPTTTGAALLLAAAVSASSPHAVRAARPYNATVPGGKVVTFTENFDGATCGALAAHGETSLWELPTWQWGGAINGGVSGQNVGCRSDPKWGNVLQLFSHGDRYVGHGPVGTDHKGTPIGPSDDWQDWKNPTYKHACAPNCHVQRVGASVRSKPAFTSATIEAMIKPCPTFGVASTMFLYSYQEETCGDPAKPNIKNTCSPAYTKQCCKGGQCIIDPNGKVNDVCRGVWVKNKEIDLEIPSSLQRGPQSVDPSLISFENARMNSVTAFPWSYKHHTTCGVNSPCESDNFVDAGVNQADGKFHQYRIVWDGINAVDVFVDGALKQHIVGPQFVPTVDLAGGEKALQVILAAWFPNAWAGSPDFSTCVTEVASVKITGTTA